MTAPYRLVVTIEFGDEESRADWLREHEDGRCSDLAPWTDVRSMMVLNAPSDAAAPDNATDESGNEETFPSGGPHLSVSPSVAPAGAKTGHSATVQYSICTPASEVPS